MKYRNLLYSLLALAVTGCSSAYKASQTPDDVYYSPASIQRASGSTQGKYEDYTSSDEDQYLRMKTRDRQRWSTLDDYTYWNDSRYVPSLSYDYYRTNWYNPYAWNNMYSPYGYSVFNSYPIYGGGFSYGYINPSYGYGYNPYSSNVYINKYPTRVYSNTNRPSLNGYTNRSYNNSNNSNRQGLGSTLRRVFAPANNGYSNSNYSGRSSSNNSSYTAPSRSYTPSSSSSSAGSSSSGGSGRVSRPSRN